MEIDRVEMVRGGDWYELGDRWVWSPVSAIGVTPSGDVELRLGIEMREGVPEVREVTLRSTGIGRPVRASDLRLKLDDLVEDAIGLAAFVQSEPDTAWRATPFGRRELAANPDLYRGPHVRPSADDGERLVTRKVVARARRRPRRKVTDDLLREVAAVYRSNIEDRPTLAVRETFGMPQSTAALYVRRARDRVDPETGKPFLGAAIEGKAGEKS